MKVQLSGSEKRNSLHFWSSLVKDKSEQIISGTTFSSGAKSQSCSADKNLKIFVAISFSRD